MNRVFVLLLLLVGCGDDDSGSSHIDASVVDAVAVDADPSCSQWRREYVGITDVASLEVTAIHPDRSARFLVDVLQCPGDLAAQPAYGFTLENEFVALTMSVWRRLPDCAAPEVVKRPVTIQFLYPGAWKFVLSDGNGMRTVTVSAAPSDSCNTAQTQCDEDCDCAVGQCMSYYGIALNPLSRCAIACEVDRDCGGNARCASYADDLQFFCETGEPECGGSAPPCPAGFDCQSGACTPTFTLNGSSRHECSCDSDCDPGLRCAFHEGAATGRCEALCLTASDAWCEGPHTCGRGSVESVPGVCGWVGD